MTGPGPRGSVGPAPGGLPGAAGIVEALEDAVPGAQAGSEFGQPTLEVPVGSWVSAVRTARDRFGFDYFDWLSALDEGDARVRVVVHLWSRSVRAHLLVQTVVAVGEALPSLTGVYAGAGWHERETAEMFGLGVTGFDDGSGRGVRPLLLGPHAPPHPLRKSATGQATSRPEGLPARAGSPPARAGSPPAAPWPDRPPGARR